MTDSKSDLVYCAAYKPLGYPDQLMQRKSKDSMEKEQSKKHTHFPLMGEWVWVVLSVTLCCVALVAWNIKLQSEINSVRQDLDYLMQIVKASSNNDEYGIKNTDPATEDRSMKESSLKAIADENMEKNNFHQMTKRNIRQTENTGELGLETNLAKSRSRERRSKKKKGMPSQKQISSGNVSLSRRPKRRRRHIEVNHERILKKNKAIGIHVQGGSDDDSSSPTRESGAASLNNFSNKFGKTITTWRTPKRHYFGFDTTDLQTTGQIKVPTNGMYFVYSQVVFATRENSFSISEIRAGFEGGSVFVQCQYRGTETSQNPRITCSSNGLVYLKKNDVISIRIHPYNLEVMLEPEYTYFGAFLVGL